MYAVIIADHAIAEGGAPEVAIASAAALAAKGVNVVFVHGVGGDADPRLSDPNIERIGFGGEDIWRKSITSAVKDGVWNRAFVARLRERLYALPRGDTVVHVHQWTKYFSPSVFAAVLNSGLPLAISMHDYFLTCPTGLMYRVDTKDACALKPMSANCIMACCDPRTQMHKMVRIARGFAVQRAIRSGRFAAIHVSQIGRATIGRFLPPATKQYVLENPVAAVDEGARTFNGQSKLVYCGRLTEEKGVVLVAQAARQAGVPALFIGEGPARETILAANSDAEITGWLAKEDVRQRILEEALAVVAPSRWPETGPLVVAEAMAAGVPTIVSNRAGAGARVRDAEDGFVVEPDAAAIVAATAALSAPGVAAAMGEAAYRRYWAAPPSLENHANGLLEIYKRLLADAWA